jgi:serine/threonine protein kinase
MHASESPSASCPLCSALVPKIAFFCSHCGTQLAHCPICKNLVLTGPTTCSVCGAQISLSSRKLDVGEPSRSMQFQDATIFFRQGDQQPGNPSPPHQALPQPVVAEHPPFPIVSQISEEEKPFNVLDAVSLPQEVQSNEIQEQLTTEEKRVTRVGQRLGNYQLIRLLGEGGFGKVYLGEHIHLGSQAAIKVLNSQLSSREIGPFLSEARTLVRLIHPHIVRILDFGIEDKTPFLVMDYAPNGTLRQLHPKGTPLPLEMIISYVKQVAEALQFAHNEKIIHRDIKPENMLVGVRQDILLSDFGIAMIAQSSRYQSMFDIAGTIAYMAPEQIQAHPRSASDQYSLGIVVYEWLCGERPFHGSFKEIAIKHAVVPPPPLRARKPSIPAAVEKAVFKALSKDPKDRFGSIWEFAVALEQEQ